MHYSILVDNHDYRREYPILVGGVIAFPPKNYIQLNGYSNIYWGWGAEDDDMYFRMKRFDPFDRFHRPKKSVKYQMFNHKKRWKNPKRVQLLGKNRKIKSNLVDGLSNVNYTLVDVIKYETHTHLMIDVGEPPAELI